MATARSSAEGAAAAAVAQHQAATRSAIKDGLGWGLELHRFVEPKDWPAALQSRVPAEHRQGAEEYLRGIAQRMRNLKAMKR